MYGHEFKGVKVNGNDVRVLITSDGIKSVLGQFEYIDPEALDVSGSLPVDELLDIASNIKVMNDSFRILNQLRRRLFFWWPTDLRYFG